MGLSSDVFKKLRESFHVELQEHVQTITEGLLALERQTAAGAAQQSLLDRIFRAAHSLKGAARTVDAKLVTQLAHALEDVLDALRRQALAATPQLFTVCHRSLDVVQDVQGLYGDVVEMPEFTEVLMALQPFLADEACVPLAAAQNPPSAPEKRASASQAPEPAPSTPRTAQEHETIRVQVGKLDALMGQLEELLVTKIRVEQRMNQLRAIDEALRVWETEWSSVRGAYGHVIKYGNLEELLPPEQVQALAQLCAFFDESQERLRQINDLSGVLAREYTNDVAQMSLVIDALEEDVKRVRMLPLSTILTPFGRMVRDLAYDSGKEAVLHVSGAETEMDKRVLEAIKDPLMHLLRNAVDHGIELPEEREARGKARYGTVTLFAEQVGKDVVLRISDDGRGLDLEAIRSAVARRQGSAPPLDSEDLEEAIFDSGISTSSVITDVSGRGVGLDVVRRNVAELGGRIDMDWAPDGGTTFTLTMPLALSRSRGLLVRVGNRRFAVPLGAIERLMLLELEQVATMGGRDVLRYNERSIPLISLCDVLALPAGGPQNGRVPSVIVVAVAERRVALVVDELEGEQEIVNKGLGRQLERVRGIAGATVLGSGEIVLVLNPVDLVEMALEGHGRASGVDEARQAAPAEPDRLYRLLIVDDSITTRTLEKNILEAAGYLVEIAMNGQDAWDHLTSRDLPDLVVSDVAMPRMDGVELTRQIKGAQRTAALPVILVTSLDSPADKARGIAAGADAYISKGTFDQNNLLNTVKQLLE